MEVTRGLNQPELTRVLNSNRLAGCVSALARYTLETASEGGFCVYKRLKTGKLTISEPHLPTVYEREQWRDTHNGQVGISDHLGEEEAKGSYSTDKLLKTPFKPRRDVGIFVHSHPNGETHLRPSSTDLEVYEFQNGLNPNIIEGILVADQNIAKIFLFGQTATRYARGQYQSFDLDFMDAQKVRGMLADDGFCTAIAEFETASGKIVSNPSQVAEQYFTPE